MAFAGHSLADRPLSSDEASTVGAQACQVEAWHERARGEHASIVAPACGFGEAVEVGLEWLSSGGDPGSGRQLSMVVKWIDPAWRLGATQWGLKAFGGRERDAAGDWHTASHGLVGLMTWEMNPQWRLRLNLGREYLHQARTYLTHGHLAATWEANDDWLLFAELQGTRNQGAATQSVGLRRWIVADRLGLDLTRGRVAGQSGSGFWTAGIGWYGIGF